MKIAILDDYQNVASKMADWSALMKIDLFPLRLTAIESTQLL